jgi:hypothetical protein
MMAEITFWVVLFKAVSYALKAEKILKSEGIPFKLIPVPKHISSDCGVCLRFTPDLKEKILQVLSGRVEISEARPLE